MLKNNYKKNILLPLLVFCAELCAKSIDKNYIQTRKDAFERYLKDLKFSMSVPTCVIKKSMNIMGYADHEVDAVPIAFPFIYDEQYKTVWFYLDETIFIEEINSLLNEIENEITTIPNKNERRKKTHYLIHLWNCKKLNLSLETTTKQLAQLVERKQIDMKQFFKYQLIQFFVKYYLNL
ncbi:MAG TPA: hypothetical protein VL201_04400 [Patescibacteria group bacterium]|jgi:hypothetical protein|nr:hypothetical protein [Patescibacteria group bacterium]